MLAYELGVKAIYLTLVDRRDTNRLLSKLCPLNMSPSASWTGHLLSSPYIVGRLVVN